MPTLSAASYVSTQYDPQAMQKLLDHPHLNVRDNEADQRKFLGAAKQLLQAGNANQVIKPIEEQKVMSNARVVKVFVADANESLPLEARILFKGDEKLTDLTDQELFFEVPIAEILAKHNDVRAKTLDKKQTEKFGREIYLEPARIRDLKMVVVTVAQF